ncbi:MAG TPA: penicillin-binding protein activator [Candidatus Saccharimonadales bacterium]|nr:penicillin-binding protein activator [Candidatus Saccharimonadales bacterium]
MDEINNKPSVPEENQQNAGVPVASEPATPGTPPQVVVPAVPANPPQPSDQPEITPATPLPPVNPPKKRRGMWLVLLIVFVVAVAGGAFYYYQSRKDKTAELPHVKVGVMMAFSGGSSSMGYGANKGIQLAKKQLGADNIELVQADSKCDPKTAASAIKKLIAQHVIAIIGEGCSSASVAALPAANNAKIPMISPSASSPTLSIPDDYFFRVVPPDTFQGAFMAQTIYDKGIRKVAVFYTNEPYGTGMNKVFQEKFEALGGKVVATATAEPDVIDLNAQIAQLKASNPEAIFIAPNSVVSGTAVIKLLRQANVTVPLFGADIMYDPTIIANAPQAAEGLTITSFPTGSKSFKQALTNEYQTTEQLYAAPQAYDAFHAIYLAVQKGATTGEEVKNILPTLNFQGVSAHIKFDQNGELSDKNYKYDLLQVVNGKFTEVE